MDFFLCLIVHQEFDPAHGVLSYYTYDVLTTLLLDLVAAYPGLAAIESLGKSLEGRELWMLKGPGGATFDLVVRSQPAGMVRQTITLNTGENN